MAGRKTESADNGEEKKEANDETNDASSSEQQEPKTVGKTENAPGPDRTSPQTNASPSSSPSPPPNTNTASTMPTTVNVNNISSSSNRPPSATPSIHSTNSGGATRTTATSRRGGRTRSRSPPMLNRASPSSHDSRGGGFAATHPSEAQATPHSPSPSNPSSAAAAAAAAAKALSNNPAAQYREGGRHSHRDPGYDAHYRNTRSWPPAEDHPQHPHHHHERSSRRSGSGGYSHGHSQSSHHRGSGSGGRGDMYSRGGGYGSDHYHAHHNMHPSYDHEHRDRRYGERTPGQRGRTPPPVDRYGHPYAYRGGSSGGGGGGMAPADARARSTSPSAGPSPASRSSSGGGGGGMSRVIGTATPIHVPRASEPPLTSRHSRSGTPASVFRGRPGSDAAPPPPPSQQRARDDRPNEEVEVGGEEEEEDNPQKILLSLRTPTSSFDEKPAAKTAKEDGSDLPPSPDEPPQIQHSHRKSTSDFFDPSRSPKGSIEMAPSFNLFNQSFDSFGDTFNVVGNLDPLQSASFVDGPTASGELAQSLQQSLSGSNIAQQLLGGGSGSAGLTFGMSPVNSFGNGPPGIPTRRSNSGNMMVLGGNERSTSPTQVLGMYHSYSGGGSHGIRGNNSMGNPLEDSHLRMSASSFGAPSLSHNYTRSFGAEPSPSMPYPGRMGHSHEEGGQIFYIFLRRHKAAFKECSFLLPGLKAALLETPLSGATKSGEHGDDPMKSSSRHGGYPEPSPHDIAIARRRVASAVCAFGGSLSGDRVPQVQQSASSDKSSIFRGKEEGPSTVTPSNSTGTPPGSRFQTPAKAKYDEMLPSRYYENENRLSWEFEEKPPVETPTAEDRAKEEAREKAEADAEAEAKKNEQKAKSEASKDSIGDGNGSGDGDGDGHDNDNTESNSKGNEDDSGDDKKEKAEDGASPSAPGSPSKQDNNSEKISNDATSPGGNDQPKMRYRCKLCGQPKQNHTCPFMQSLARSIGINVYPAVNAFTAAEPGVVAPPLSEMNNFVASDDCSVADSKASGHPTPERRMNGSTQVTPESRRSSKPHQMGSPSSTMSTGSTTPQRPRTPASARNRSGSSARNTPASSSRRSRKRRHNQMYGGGPDEQGDLLFVEPMELKAEQFRTITPSKNESLDAYTYPALPLPYAQRKRLSDNLFSLSQKVPQLTKECSAVLREAREKDLWDLAVAELMTQVVVVIHCHDGDSRFEGLRQYLLTLGIAC